MIVVGVDGSPHAERALRWALEEAKLRGTDVLALYVWSMPAPPPELGFYSETLQDPVAYRDGAERLLEGIIAAATEDAAGVRLEHRAVQGSPADELVHASKGAELLVVGSRGHGAVSSLLLGSVSHQCVHSAACPVVVVHDRSG